MMFLNVKQGKNLLKLTSIPSISVTQGAGSNIELTIKIQVEGLIQSGDDGDLYESRLFNITNGITSNAAKLQVTGISSGTSLLQFQAK